ncbi:MAG: hypothetical protein B6U94_00260 [Thermofilum sp. ex4484_79]|nr:MAG: hypothetical protein B6U94_00260 [Thermofilum sp. ex4484_79]
MRGLLPISVGSFKSLKSSYFFIFLSKFSSIRFFSLILINIFVIIPRFLNGLKFSFWFEHVYPDLSGIKLRLHMREDIEQYCDNYLREIH